MVPALGIKCTTAEIRAINEVGLKSLYAKFVLLQTRIFHQYSKPGICRILNIQNQVVEDCLEVALSAQLEVEQIEMEEEVRKIMCRAA